MPAAYDQLVVRLKRAHTLGTVTDLLGWDEQVHLPPDSADVRAEQLAVMAETQHAAATDPEIGEPVAYRVCDEVAHRLSMIEGMPKLEFYWPETKRNAALAAIVEFIRKTDDHLRMKDTAAGK